MRNLTILLLILCCISCSQDSSNGGGFTSEGGGQGGSLARFTIKDDYLYTVGNEELSVFNITDPNAPIYIGQQYIGFEIETIFANGDFLYIGSTLGIYIYDITNRSQPTQLSQVSHLRSCDPVVSDGNYSYVTLHTNANCVGTLNQLEVYDTTDPTNPVWLHTRQMARPIGLGLYGNYLFVTDEGQIAILDVINPANPTLVNSITTDAFDVIIRNNILISIGSDELKQFQLDPSDIQNIQELSTIAF